MADAARCTVSEEGQPLPKSPLLDVSDVPQSSVKKSCLAGSRRACTGPCPPQSFSSAEPP